MRQRFVVTAALVSAMSVAPAQAASDAGVVAGPAFMARLVFDRPGGVLGQALLAVDASSAGPAVRVVGAWCFVVGKGAQATCTPVDKAYPGSTSVVGGDLRMTLRGTPVGDLLLRGTVDGKHPYAPIFTCTIVGIETMTATTPAPVTVIWSGRTTSSYRVRHVDEDGCGEYVALGAIAYQSLAHNTPK